MRTSRPSSTSTPPRAKSIAADLEAKPRIYRYLSERDETLVLSPLSLKKRQYLAFNRAGLMDVTTPSLMGLGKTVNNPASSLSHLQGPLSHTRCPQWRGKVNEQPCAPVLERTRKSTYRNIAFTNVIRACFYVIFCPKQLLIMLELDTMPYPVDEIPVLDELVPLLDAFILALWRPR
ncbi:hypothetical protein DFH94DRAFT_725017 [Russula ochroleuca]|jgi:hypothetical protein|uniref:Uncharacterized protein n=1 Tax=Russula ochroleuca TaxID=152965 RepID=A0A9P5TC73_9AGAM|nr:hypothetical protein DFH94DRAFT_725017 [Russula ochroleuca]